MTTSKGRILVIEDDQGIQEFMSMALTDEGYQVVLASNGAVGLQLVEVYHPHLILLDMLMPVMDGKTFLEAYREYPPPRARIIALSASKNLKNVAKPMGVDDFLGKPFDLDELLHCVEVYIHATN